MPYGLSYFRLEFDTTKPTLNIYLPNNTTDESYEEITIVANEKMASKHEIYIVDSKDLKHPQTFYFDGDRTYEGTVDFNAFPKGMATIYVTLYDEVWNRSDLYRAYINVVDPREIKMILNEKIRVIDIKNYERKPMVYVDSSETEIETEIIERKAIANLYNTEHEISLKTMPIETFGKDEGDLNGE